MAKRKQVIPTEDAKKLLATLQGDAEIGTKAKDVKAAYNQHKKLAEASKLPVQAHVAALLLLAASAGASA